MVGCYIRIFPFVSQSGLNGIHVTDHFRLRGHLRDAGNPAHVLRPTSE